MTSPSKLRQIYFDSHLEAQRCHELVMEAQGFRSNPLRQYHTLKNIADGPFGRVTLCEHNYSKLQVVVKEVSKKAIESTFAGEGDAYREEAIMREVCQGEVSNMVELLECFESFESFFIVTKYESGGDLCDFLIKQSVFPLPENTVRNIVWQIVSAMRGLHANNILHRDIKINNILVSESSGSLRCCLADLGSAVKLSA